MIKAVLRSFATGALAGVLVVIATLVLAQPGLPLPVLAAEPAGMATTDPAGAGFGADPACREMSNGCRVCVRGRDGAPACSLSGIACVPTGWQCRTGSSNDLDSEQAR